MNYLNTITEVDILKCVLDCVRDIDKMHEQAKTERYAIRQRCEVANNIINTRSEDFRRALAENSEIRSGLLRTLEALALRPNIDEYVLEFSANVLSALRDADPMRSLNYSTDIRSLL